MVTTAKHNLVYVFVNKYGKVIFDTKNIMADIKDRENIEVL